MNLAQNEFEGRECVTFDDSLDSCRRIPSGDIRWRVRSRLECPPRFFRSLAIAELVSSRRAG